MSGLAVLGHMSNKTNMDVHLFKKQILKNTFSVELYRQMHFYPHATHLFQTEAYVLFWGTVPSTALLISLRSGVESWSWAEGSDTLQSEA